MSHRALTPDSPISADVSAVVSAADGALAVPAATSPRVERDPLAVPALERPLHDEGPLFVPQPPRAIGDTVTVRVWVPDAWPLQTVALRSLVDAEISTRVLRRGERDGAGYWWSTTVTTVNPVHPYRFSLIGPGDPARDIPPYAWLTAAGIMPWDVSDATDFRLVSYEGAPSWVDDAVVYQIFPDRFARSQAAPSDAAGRPALPDMPSWAQPMPWDVPPAEDGHVNGTQLYGGDLDGITEHLDYIQSLGATVLYLTPVFPAGSVHRYDATTFDTVDPLLGGDGALVRLAEALHARGMRLMLDLTTNHTGVTHEWFRAAQADASSVEAGFYEFSQHPDGYRSWIDVPSLPSLNHASAELGRRLLRGPASVVGRYLGTPFFADGWRIDVAHMTGRNGTQDLNHEVARTIRATMRQMREVTGRDTWLLAEHGHDATGDLAGDGWHGTMNYAGFTRPLWAWLSRKGLDLNWLGLPMSVPHLPGWAAVHTLRDYGAQMSLPARQHSQNQLSSHDTPRMRTVMGTREHQATALAAQVALPGVPTLFAGDELGLPGRNGEHSRTPMPWDAITQLEQTGTVDAPVGTVAAAVDPLMPATVRELLALRREHAALRHGGVQWLHASTDAITLLRTHPTGHVLVHLARAAHSPVAIDVASLPGCGVARVLDQRHGATASVSDGRVVVSADGAGSVFVELAPAA